MFTKSIITSHTKPELVQIVGGIDSNTELTSLEEASGRKIRTEERVFPHKGAYGPHIVLQKGLFIINDSGKILLSSGGNLPPDTETLLVSGSGNKNYRKISKEKLRGVLGDDASEDVFALSEIRGALGAYAFIVKAILAQRTLTSQIGRALTWTSPDDISNNHRITAMEKNLFYYFRTQLGL